MKWNKRVILMLTGIVFVLFACKKEYSFETSHKPSEGSLQEDGSGDCLPKIVGGIYETGVELDKEVHYIQVEVDVTEAGNYTVSSDTVNGIYFTTTGIFTNTGLVSVKLKGSGKPVASGISNFTISYNGSSCVVPITILAPGANIPAVFTLAGGPSTCLDAVVEGEYVKDQATNSSHFVKLKVNVTTAGSYAITTVISNGLNFSGSGTLATGAQEITLYASGTPLVIGNTNVPVNASGSGCSFSFEVKATGEPSNSFGWEFVSGGITYKGAVEDAEVLFEVGIGSLSFNGIDEDNDRYMGFVITSNGPLTPGEYKPELTGARMLGVFGFETMDDEWAGGIAITGSTLSVVLTEYNATTKVVAGTFSGTLKSITDGSFITVTNGKFRASFP